MRPLSTGLSLVVVERAQAEPPPPLIGLCWRLHRLRSLEEEEAPSSLDVEPGHRAGEVLIVRETTEQHWRDVMSLNRCSYQTTRGAAASVTHTWASSTASRCGCELCPAMLRSVGFGLTPARTWSWMKDEETRLWSAVPPPCCWAGCRFEAQC